MGKCPCCGGYVEDSGLDVLRSLPLAKQKATILRKLLNAYPKWVGLDELIRALYPRGTAKAKMPNQVVRVQVHRINYVLWNYGWEIKALRKAPDGVTLRGGPYVLRRREQRR